MILAINYADEKYKRSQKFNSCRMISVGKADKVTEYTPSNLDEKFRNDHGDILSEKRGSGFWIWKPYIILDALSKIDIDDYLVYTDSGSAILAPISLLINAMENDHQDIMCFTNGNNLKECYFTKRDAFILMNCDDNEDICNTPQICAGYIIIKKNKKSVEHVQRWAKYISDRRIVSDDPNVMGKDNYPGFKENRHDQSIWSILCKLNGFRPFRNPSQFGNNHDNFSDDVNTRSSFPQMFDIHRQGNIGNVFEWKYYNQKRKILDLIKRNK